MRPDRNRRRLLAGALGLAVLGPVRAAALQPTPPGPAGPFYPRTPLLDDDNDLTRVAGRDGVARGRISDLGGRVLDTAGRPIAGARVEIWQCDANGRYHHPRDRGAALDPNFQGFGHTLADPEGRYRFRTIRPVPYPGRTPHIHFAVFAPGADPFVTQLYVLGEPANPGDFLFQRVPAERRHLVLAAFEPITSADAELAARFDIVLGITPASA